MNLHPSGHFDNSAKTYQHISVSPLAAAMGAEIENLQISQLNDAQFAEIEQALYRHKMLYLRDQDMSLDDQEAFTQRFGAFGVDAYTAGTAGHPNIQPVIKEAGARTAMIFGSGWHTDSPFMQAPPAISMVFGADIPPYGGDTMWCNSALAYSYLSDTMKQVLAGLKVHMTAREVVGELSKMGQQQQAKSAAFENVEFDDKTRAMVAGWFHPLVRTHPKSGEKSLYLDHTYSHGIEGMTEAEAQGLLVFLKAHVSQPAFSCRLRWKPKTFVFWDNRLCIHQAFNDYDGFRRELYRSTVMGEEPG